MRSTTLSLLSMGLIPTILSLSPPIHETTWTQVDDHPFRDAPNALPVPFLPPKSLSSRFRFSPYFSPLPIYQPTTRETDIQKVPKRGVIGTEDRHLLTPDQLANYPTIAIGRLMSSRPGPNGTAFVTRCTGSLIGPRHIATAAHCMHPEFPEMQIRFQPGFDQEEKGDASYVEKYYREDTTKFENDPGCEKYADIAILILQDRLGDKVGWLNVRKVEKEENKEGMRFTQQGYPGDLYAGNQPVRQENIKVVKEADCNGEGPLWTDADAAGGMSGGPLWAEGTGMEGARLVLQYGVLSSGFKIDGEWLASFSAGRAFVDMADRARREFP